MENQENDMELPEYTYPPEYEDNLCKYCQKRAIDKSENPDSILCGECRETLIHYPIPKKLYAAIAVILVLFAAALFFFPKSLKDYKTYKTSGKVADSGYPFTSLESLDALMEEYPDSISIPLEITEIAVRHGYYDYAAYAIDEYLAGAELTDSQYDTAMGYIHILDTYYNTSDYISGLMEDESIMTAEDIQGRLLPLLSSDEYNSPLLYYYLGLTSQDADKAMEYLQTCYEIDRNYTDAAAQLANYHRRMNDLAKARELLESAYDWNKEDSSVLRSYAILKLLEGDSAGGLALAEEAYDYFAEGTYVVDTYIVALAVNGRTQEAEAIKQEWTEQGYEFDPELDTFLAGNMSLEEYYIDEL